MEEGGIELAEKWILWSRNLKEWSELNYVYKVHAHDLHWRDSNATERAYCKCDKILDAYRFRVGIKNFATSNQQRATAQLVRDIADKWEYRDLKTVFYASFRRRQQHQNTLNTFKHI